MSIPYKTLEVYHEKVTDALGQVEARIAECKQLLFELERQEIAINAQIETLEQLMNEKPIVELPFAGEENIQERFENRFKLHEDLSPEEVYEKRQDTVYFNESMESVEALHAANESEASQSE